MDLRTQKTQKAVKNAFLQLRSKKPLERITVKELTETAEISKATFYLHYQDIYDLSNQLQKEVIQNILNRISDASCCLTDSKRFTQELIDAFRTQQSLVDILFSGSQAAILPMSIEEGVKECVFSQNPQFRDDVKINVLITYQVQGTFFAQKEHISRFGSTQVLQVIDDVSDMFAKMTRTYKLQEVHGDE